MRETFKPLFDFVGQRAVAGQDPHLPRWRHAAEQRVDSAPPLIVHSEQRVVENQRQPLPAFVEVVEHAEPQAEKDLIQRSPADRIADLDGFAAPIERDAEQPLVFIQQVDAPIAAVGDFLEVAARPAQHVGLVDFAKFALGAGEDGFQQCEPVAFALDRCDLVGNVTNRVGCVGERARGRPRSRVR